MRSIVNNTSETAWRSLPDMDTSIEEASLGQHARQCMLSFNECEAHSAHLPLQDKAMIEDQAGRFSVWASNIGALAPARASLDYRLRQVEEVRRLVKALLLTLDESIQKYISHLRPPGASQDESERDSASLSSSLDPVLKEIADQISLLHQISNLIRKASSQKHSIKAANDFVIRDDNGDDYGPTFRDGFALRIIRQLFPRCPEGIQQRLADAMLLRRKQILYQYSRYGKSPLRSTASAPSGRIPVYSNNKNVTQGTSSTADPQPGSNTNPARRVASSQAQSATTLDNDQRQKVSTAPSISASTIFQPTQDEKLSFPNAPKKSIRVRLKHLRAGCEADLERQLESIPNYHIYKQYDGHPPLDSDIIEQIKEKIGTLKAKTNEAIEREEESCRAGSMEATCPYCCCIISSAIIMNKNKWVNHVRHDIGPYVCLFENCDTPSDLYNHSNSWAKHMRQHNKHWCCAAKAHGVLVFSSRSQYEDHMATRHKVSQGQLQLLAERQYRSLGPLFQVCPLCGEGGFDTSLQRHIAIHLVFLALKSLPSLDDGESCDPWSDLSEDSDIEDGEVQRNILHDQEFNEERSHISADDPESVEGDEDDVETDAADETSREMPMLPPPTIDEFEGQTALDGPESPRISEYSEPPQVEAQVGSSGLTDRQTSESLSGTLQVDNDLSAGHDIVVCLPGADLSRGHLAIAAFDTQCKGINLMSVKVYDGLRDYALGYLELAGNVGVRSLGSETIRVIGVARRLEWRFKHGVRTYTDDFHIIDSSRFDVLIGSDTIRKYELLMPGPDLQRTIKSKGGNEAGRGVRDRIRGWVANLRDTR